MTAGRCADLSEEAGESLAATATSVATWLLVEERGTWPRDVSDASAFGEPGSTRIAAWLADVPSSRLLFIRRPGPERDRRLVFVVRASEQEAHVRRLELGRADDLADADLDASGDVVDAQLVLVCGHGTRDACCALRGSAVFGALAADLDPDSLWLSSHQGGHRFAANVLVLPSGIHLGRVAPEDASRLVGDALVGRIPLDHYRGRTAYSAREQAAEGFVRAAEGLASLGDLRLVGDDGVHVRFRVPDGRELRARPVEVTGPTVPASCGVEPSPQKQLVATLD
jgi:hypothetical protein